MKREMFIEDLEQVRLEILNEKIQAGLNEFDKEPRTQWTPLRLEKPLLHTLLRLVEQEISIKEGGK